MHSSSLVNRHRLGQKREAENERRAAGAFARGCALRFLIIDHYYTFPGHVCLIIHDDDHHIFLLLI